MAEVKNIQINVDTKQATKAMDNLAKATHDVSASFEEVYGDIQPLTARMGEAEDRLYELANAGKTTTKEYQDLLKTVGDYRKVQIQTDLAVDAAATTMTQKLGGALNGVTAGFSLAQGVMGTFGAESEQIEKALLKVQSAMAIQQGIQGFREAIPSFKALKTAVVSGFTGMTTASKVFMTTGVLALVGALTYLLTNVKVVTRAFEDFTDWLGITDNAAKRNAKAIEDNAKRVAAANNMAMESSKKRADVIAASYDHEIKMAEINGKNTTKLEIERSQNMSQKARERYNIALKEYNDLQGINKAYAIERRRELKDILDTEKSTIQSERFAREEARAQDKKDRSEDYAEQKEEKLQQARERYEAATKELAEIRDKELKPIELEKIKIRQEGLSVLQGQLNEESEMKRKANEQELLELQVKGQRAAKIAEQANSFQVKATLDGLSAIASISELFAGKSEKAAKRAFQVQKAANIATALITTYQNATSAYASQFTPIPTPDSPIRGGIAAGIAVASGLANVAKISQQKFEGGGSVGGGGGGGTGGGGSIPSMSPSFNVVGNSGFNQLAQIQQTPMQAYVVSGEVTSAQALDRNRVKNATL
jgi:hypothetical protein